MKNTLHKIRDVQKTVDTAYTQLELITKEIDELKQTIKELIIKRVEESKYTTFNEDFLDDFLKEPYVIIPKRTEKGNVTEWYVVVPRIIDFQLGWLERSTRSYNVFLVNRYVRWFSEIPNEIGDRFREQPLPVMIRDGLLLSPEDKQDEVWKRYRQYLSRREGSGAIRITKGKEFELIASIIEDGTLPFTPKKVDSNDLRPFTKIELRDYQQDAFKEFLKFGAIGIYFPFGTGKSFLGVYINGRMKGRKLVVVPTITLKEQWNENLRKYGIGDVQIETYRAFNKVKNIEWNLITFDECHHLPANTYIKLATLKTKYRLGLSGSPYREDGRVNYIIALTGYPIGLAWEKFFELGIIKKPTVNVKIVTRFKDKIRYFEELIQKETGKTIIFCDSLDLGERLSRKHNLQFVYGQTRNRLELIRENEKVIVSRVGDEGLSIPEIDTVIEIDFLYGSRMQESQRIGRLLHSESEVTNHYIIMTEEELERYGKRLYAIYERGYKVNIIR